MPAGPGPNFSWSLVYGQATVYVALGVSDLQFLGVAAEAPKIQFMPKEELIPSDVAGPRGYSDVQDMGEIARITAKLTAIDLTVLDAMIAWRKGTSAAGEAGARGTPIFYGNRYLRLAFGFALTPLRFPVCRLLEPLALDAGTRYSALDFVWEAWSVPSIAGSGSVSFTDLYDNVLA